MKKRCIFTIFAVVLVCAVLLETVPLSSRAFAAEKQAFELPNEAPAGLEFTSDPVFSKSGYEPMLTCRYNIAWYDYGNYKLFLDESGNPITSEKLNMVWMVFGDLQTAQPQGSSKYAVYWKGRRITEPIYTDFHDEGDCLIAVKDNGMDFFGADGKQRTPGVLPAGWEPRRISSAGTVVARKYNPGIIDSTGIKHYNVALFDRNGNQLYKCSFTGTDDNEEINLYTDRLLLVHGSKLIDLYGKEYGNSGVKLIGESDDRHVVSRFQNDVWDVWDLDHRKLGSFEASELRDSVGSALVIGRNGRYGMVDQNGTVIVEPEYLYFHGDQQIAYQKPSKRAVMFETLDHNYVVYSDSGVKLGEFREPVDIYPNCMLRSGSDGSTYVYDSNGKLTQHYDAGMSFRTMNGVCFLCDGSSSLYYVVDLYGNRCSERGFSELRKDNEPVYGLVNVKRGSGWYVVNAAGTILNDEQMDRPVEFTFPLFAGSNPEKLLGVYSMNGKNGICRYFPPITACEKSTDGTHDWQLSKVLKEATCTETGEAVYQCAKCKKTRTETTPTDPEAHAWRLTEILSEPEEGESLHEGVGLYTCTRCNETKEARLCAGEVFTDMPAEGNWAHKPIDWAYFSGVTSGKTATSFEPKTKITRAEAMTFLWTAAGKPTSTLSESPFTDVTAGKYYYKPVLWAVEHHITGGKTETSFAPKAQCSRAEIMTFLWNAVGKPAHSLAESPFTDVTPGKYYYNAVLWAYEKGVTGGTTDTTFSPKTVCTRAQVVTFLYKVKDLLAAEPVEAPEGNDPACQ